MSSALAMVLTAALALPGNGPEKVSGEMEPPGFDLSGEWVAITYTSRDVFRGEAYLNEQGRLFVAWRRKDGTCVFTHLYDKAVDEGSGRLRMGPYLGIYERFGDNLRLCVGEVNHRPKSFRAGVGQHVIILYRVKPRK